MHRAHGYAFLNDEGDFSLADPHRSSGLYFPITNGSSLMACVTPTLGGDLKTSQDTFLLEPVSVENLHNNRSGRNFWVHVRGVGAWSCAGASARQVAENPDDAETVRVEAGMLWHRLIRANKALGLRAEATTFSPAGADAVELTRFTVTNIGTSPTTLTPTAAMPLYGRSATDLRDHRHVTALLHRIRTTETGVAVTPSYSFDERGHRLNHVAYGVHGAEADGTPPVGFFPETDGFLGEGGTFDWPEAVVANRPAVASAGGRFEGGEAVGALRFADVCLAPGDSKTWIIALAVADPVRDEHASDGNPAPPAFPGYPAVTAAAGGEPADPASPGKAAADTEALCRPYLSADAFASRLGETMAFWRDKLDAVGFAAADASFGPWMRWVSLQPILRRIYGCSFLPHHDYGRGGRGWRDLWQDCLALLVMEPEGVRRMLLDNFAGVRLDGSNATIIGTTPGTFVADRNGIARCWMDHGAWPYLTVRLYLEQTGDLAFLLESQTWFKDRLARRAKAADEAWTPAYGNRQRRSDGGLCEGTVLEHLLLENLVPFFRVGTHNCLRLEDADWNDAFDMAGTRGESVAFSHLYAANLAGLAGLIDELAQRGMLEGVSVHEEAVPLFDTLAGSGAGTLTAGRDADHSGDGGTDSTGIDYGDPQAKHVLLESYFDRIQHEVSGVKRLLPVKAVAADLRSKADWLAGHLRRQEFIRNQEGHAWFNGYYDDHGRRVEGDFPTGVRMTMTGQVFALMGGVATEAQARSIVRAADRYLFDPKMGGYRLNTDFREVKTDMGRCFGFAFGHKENGAMFSHMAVMYANALYQRGFVREGHRVLESIRGLCGDFDRARIYPGIPEYINEKGRGMYHYLTGSASWLLLTVLHEVFGVKGRLGDLCLEPKLVREEFGAEGTARAIACFAGKRLEVVYSNPDGLDAGEYVPGMVTVGDRPVACRIEGGAARIARPDVEALGTGTHRVCVVLVRRPRPA